MQSVWGCVLIAAITLPLSYLVARGCLDGIIRLLHSLGVPKLKAGR